MECHKSRHPIIKESIYGFHLSAEVEDDLTLASSFFSLVAWHRQNMDLVRKLQQLQTLSPSLLTLLTSYIKPVSQLTAIAYRWELHSSQRLLPAVSGQTGEVY